MSCCLMKIKWEENAWQEYVDWQQINKANISKINRLIKDIQRNPFTGIGKPEPLKYGLSGCWSRRIDGEHRLVYRIENDELVIIQCYGHYHCN